MSTENQDRTEAGGYGVAYGRAGLITWDWREQPSIDNLADLISELTDGRVSLYMADTGSDEYALIVSTKAVSSDAVDVAYSQYRATGEARWTW